MFGEEEGKALNISQAIPDIHDFTGQIDHTWQGAYPVKTHFPISGLPPRMHSRSAVHIIRHPLDVVDSSIAYLKPDTDAQRKELIEAFCDYGSIEPWRTMLGYGSWEDNAKSWINEKHDFPCLCLRYEDMLEDPHGHIRKIASFIEVEVNDERVEDIARRTSFSAMKTDEEKEVETGAPGVFTDEQIPGKLDFRFMRSGEAGGYKKNLSEEEVSRLTDYFKPIMEPFGYQ